eukprot:CAMPEP_0206320000 /NCGR_PEP_ID=MMETSP0106_2-20121207/18080_1 /ASSEMBLY_ACC=CAM_ASM_000206 /TAXON_ID=81532 /ORGANISM="Acanthoeca-like sp., Strain 10tr" /LENGTH=145 /DNA_ID=CAMNT_0053751919 /DNA_START=158 /DNA_END=592 /DNA_ORIENTATION=-
MTLHTIGAHERPQRQHVVLLALLLQFWWLLEHPLWSGHTPWASQGAHPWCHLRAGGASAASAGPGVATGDSAAAGRSSWMRGTGFAAAAGWSMASGPTGTGGAIDDEMGGEDRAVEISTTIASSRSFASSCTSTCSLAVTATVPE